MDPIPLREDGLTEDGENPMVAALRQYGEERVKEDQLVDLLKELWPELRHHDPRHRSWDELPYEQKLAMAKWVFR